MTQVNDAKWVRRDPSDPPHTSNLDPPLDAVPAESPVVPFTPDAWPLVPAGEPVKTMSSLKIAELTGKDHANVLKDIRRILEEAKIDAVRFNGIYLDAYRREKPCYHLPRLECDLVVSGYSVPYRLAIIDRWRELEAKEAVSSAAPNAPRPLGKALCCPRTWPTGTRLKHVGCTRRRSRSPGSKHKAQSTSRRRSAFNEDVLLRDRGISRCALCFDRWIFEMCLVFRQIVPPIFEMCFVLCRRLSRVSPGGVDEPLESKMAHHRGVVRDISASGRGRERRPQIRGRRSGRPQASKPALRGSHQFR